MKLYKLDFTDFQFPHHLPKPLPRHNNIPHNILSWLKLHQILQPQNYIFRKMSGNMYSKPIMKQWSMFYTKNWNKWEIHIFYVIIGCLDIVISLDIFYGSTTLRHEVFLLSKLSKDLSPKFLFIQELKTNNIRFIKNDFWFKYGVSFGKNHSFTLWNQNDFYEKIFRSTGNMESLGSFLGSVFYIFNVIERS